jgi:lipoprotein NlpD
MSIDARRWGVAALRFGAAGLVLALVGCSTSMNRAPVEDRMSGSRGSAAPTSANAPVPPGLATATATPADATKPLPGIENLGKPGYYAVKPGDTLIRIGLESGQNWKDLVKWNNLDNPNVIEVGQVVRVVPPGADATATAIRPVAGTSTSTSAKTEPRPLDAKPANGAASGASAPAITAAAPAVAPPAPVIPVAPTATVAPPPVAREGDDDVNWAWPAAGSVFAGFEEGKAKGLVISGKAGDPVLAAADGRVVYAGSGLRGYGNLVILKHNNTYLTAYAHNQVLLVKEDQAVRRGQKIAEMGSSDAERVQLHFEIRKQGKPIDPARLLPPR